MASIRRELNPAGLGKGLLSLLRVYVFECSVLEWRVLSFVKVLINVSTSALVALTFRIGEMTMQWMEEMAGKFP